MRMAFPLLALLLVNAGLACTRVSEAPIDSELGRLIGRCVGLKRPLLYVPSTKPSSVDGSLAELNDHAGAQEQNDLNGNVIPAGTKLIIERVLLQKTFEGRHAIIIGRLISHGPTRQVSLFLLFNSAWRMAAEVDAFEKRPSASVGMNALEAELAQWCGGPRN